MAIASALAAARVASGDIRLVGAPEPIRFEAGRTATVRLYVLNDGPTDATFTPPAVIRASLVHGDRIDPVEVRPVGDIGPMSLPPQGFGVLQCAISPPAGTSPSAFLRLDETAVAEATIPPAATASVAGSTDQVVPGVDAAKSGDRPATEAGLVEYRPLRFAAYEPIYFLYGTEQPNAKFQISFKYQFVPPDSPLGRKAPALTGFHVGYTQISFWDLEGESKPFFDNSYKPELLWLWDDIRPGDWGPIKRLDLQLGVQHESNGRSGDESRSLNIAYVRPTVTFGDRSDWFVSVAPRIWSYIGSNDDNDDIEQFRGYGDLKLVVGKGDGLQIAATGRLGADGDRGSLQVDVSYPIRKVLFDSFDVYLHGQYFTGYGESLLRYDDSDSTFRLGISLVR